MQLGELSSGRQALEGADLASGTTATLNALRDPTKRPPRPREDVPQIPPHRPFELDEMLFSRNLRSAKKEGTDFGQSRFGHPDLTNFGQSIFGHRGFGPANFGQSQFWPIQFWPIQFWPIFLVSWWGPHPEKGWGPEGWGPEGWGPEGWGPEGWGAQNFAFFFPSPATVFYSFSLSFGLFREFWWCLKRRDPQTCTFEGPGLQKHHQNSTKRTKREGEKNKHFCGRGKKRAKFWAVRRRRVLRRGSCGGGPGGGGPAEGRSGGGALNTPTTHTTTTKQQRSTQQHKQVRKTTQNTNPHQHQPQHNNTKNGLAKNGLAKIGLAKIGQTTNH